MLYGSNILAGLQRLLSRTYCLSASTFAMRVWYRTAFSLAKSMKLIWTLWTINLILICTVTSHGHHAISHHKLPDRLLDRLFKLITKHDKALLVTEIRQTPVDSLHKLSVMRKVSPYHGIIVNISFPVLNLPYVSIAVFIEIKILCPFIAYCRYTSVTIDYPTSLVSSK